MHATPLPFVPALKSMLRPLVPEGVLAARAERAFFADRSWYAKHLGRFGSFAAAQAYIARQGLPSTGYVLDHGNWLKERIRLRPHDYPPLFWLQRLAQEGRLDSVVDFGGSVGVSYFAFGRYLDWPAGLTWRVCELPEAVAAGEEIARERGAVGLSFSSDRSVLASGSVLYAAGALHYIEDRLVDVLEENGARPEVLVLNKLPLAPGAGFVTVEGGGHGFYPCRVASEMEFVAELRALGYRLRDRWMCLEHRMEVALHPELSFKSFQGMVWERG